MLREWFKRRREREWRGKDIEIYGERERERDWEGRKTEKGYGERRYDERWKERIQCRVSNNINGQSKEQGKISL